MCKSVKVSVEWYLARVTMLQVSVNSHESGGSVKISHVSVKSNEL